MRVRGEGPETARVMLIGEASGRDEDKVGRPFVGAAGRELSRFLESVGIERSDCYVTNIVKTRPPENRDPTEFEIANDAEELRSELARIRPEIVVPLGRIAARQFLGDVDVEDVHGIPYSRDGRTILVCYHPAAGLHSPELQAFLQYDFEQLKLLIDGKIPASEPVDQFPNPNYGLQPVHWKIEGPDYTHSRVMAIDTEGVSGRVWGLSYTFTEGTALVVKADDHEGLRWVQYCIDHAGLIALHNALHDLPILAEMGLKVPISKTVDTMIMSYILCLEPQGLKPLARRHCGMSMQSYPEIVREADQRIAREYLGRVISERVCESCSGVGIKLVKSKSKTKMVERKCGDCDGDGTTWPKPEPQLVRDPNGQFSEYNAQSIGRTIRKALWAEDGKIDLRSWWEDRDRETRKMIESTVGEMRAVSLDDVTPIETAINYSARDADATLRVYRKLKPRIEAMNLDGILKMDLDILPMVDRMQQNGWLIDIPYFNGLTIEFETEMGRLERRLNRLSGRYVNPSSPKQVADLLFRNLKLNPLKMTKSKTRESTDDKTLESLSLSADPSDERTTQILETILHFRELQKLVGTYTRPLPLWADRNGRVHPHLRVTRTASGRLSSFEPNLQNIPIKAKRGRDNGKRIRAGFVCRDGWRLGSWDLCLVPGTRVLTADLRWVPIELIQPGDRLVAMDENRPDSFDRRGSRKERCMRTAVAERVGRRRTECFEICTSDGKRIVASTEHPWLAKIMHNPNKGRSEWVKTRDLHPGQLLNKLVEPWEEDKSWEAGWLAGLLDGEGSFSRQNATITFTQNAGSVMDAAAAALKRRGYDFHEPYSRLSEFSTRGSFHIWMCGIPDCMHLLGTLRPKRLLENIEALWEGKHRPRNRRQKISPTRCGPVSVVSITPVGERDVVTLQTSTRTFIAEGFFTHNSQIEMRVLGHLSGDENLIRLFVEGENCVEIGDDGKCLCHDIHLYTAGLIYRKPVSEVTSNERLLAKNVGFGIVYGITAQGLKAQMELRGQHWSEEECQEMIDAYLDRAYPGVRDYMSDREAEARRFGFVRDMFGRIRYLPAVHSTAHWVASEAVRQAGNHGIQSGATGVMKLIMIKLQPVFEMLWEQGFGVEPLMAVHDELIVEFEDGLEGLLDPMFKKAFSEAADLRVPIVSQSNFGLTWAALK